MKKVFVEKEEIIYYVRRRRSSKMGKKPARQKTHRSFFHVCWCFFGGDSRIDSCVMYIYNSGRTLAWLFLFPPGLLRHQYYIHQENITFGADMTIAGDIYKYRIFFNTHSRPPFDPATRQINLFERDIQFLLDFHMLSWAWLAGLQDIQETRFPCYRKASPLTNFLFSGDCVIHPTLGATTSVAASRQSS